MRFMFMKSAGYASAKRSGPARIAPIQCPKVQAVLSSASVALLAMRCSMHLASILVQKYVVDTGTAGISDSAEALEGSIAWTRIKVGLEFRE